MTAPIATYHQIRGLGVEPAPSVFSRRWVMVALGVGALTAAYFLFGRKALAKNSRRRHRRNGKWSSAYKNSLPDSAFLLVQSGGQAMIEHGHKVTIPRNLRKFPYRNRDGSVNLTHLRNAIARIPQSKLPQSLKTALQAKARSILAEHGGYARARTAGSKGVLRAAA